MNFDSQLLKRIPRIIKNETKTAGGIQLWLNLVIEVSMIINAR